MSINFLIGRKMGMTRVFDKQGSDYPVTIIEAGPCAVTMVKSLEKYNLSLSTDRKRAEKLEYINYEGTSGSKKADELLNTVLAAWTHPEGANNSFTRILNSTSFSKDIVNIIN